VCDAGLKEASKTLPDSDPDRDSGPNPTMTATPPPSMTRWIVSDPKRDSDSDRDGRPPDSDRDGRPSDSDPDSDSNPNRDGRPSDFDPNRDSDPTAVQGVRAFRWDAVHSPLS